jgi:hypothetical protein
MHDGVLLGDDTGTKIVCYFDEPLPAADTKLQCP